MGGGGGGVTPVITTPGVTEFDVHVQQKRRHAADKKKDATGHPIASFKLKITTQPG
jgi:hypothetical protein